MSVSTQVTDKNDHRRNLRTKQFLPGDNPLTYILFCMIIQLCDKSSTCSVILLTHLSPVHKLRSIIQYNSNGCQGSFILRSYFCGKKKKNFTDIQPIRTSEEEPTTKTATETVKKPQGSDSGAYHQIMGKSSKCGNPYPLRKYSCSQKICLFTFLRKLWNPLGCMKGAHFIQMLQDGTRVMIIEKGELLLESWKVKFFWALT